MPKTATQSNKLDHAIEIYIAAGYHLTPLKGKVPTAAAWPKTPFNPFAKPDDFPTGNFGVVLQDDDLVIDVDPRNFQKGVDSMETLSKYVPGIVAWDTPTIKTGSGGLHIYLKKPANYPTKELVRNLPGIEFKTKGRQVVGLGSLHPDTGKPYELLAGSFETILMAPAALLDLLRKVSLEQSQGSGAYDDNQQAVNRYIEYLKRAPIAIQGQHGDHTTFMVAAVAHDIGLTPEKAFDLMDLHYNMRCEPPWKARDLLTKIRNAYKYSENSVGNMSPSTRFGVITIEDKEGIWDRLADGVTFKKTLKNTINCFMVENSPLNGLIAFNEFTQDIIFLRKAPWHNVLETPSTWTDEECLRCKAFLASEPYKFEPQTHILHEAAVVVAQKYSFHPVRDYLDSLEWDHHARLSEWTINYLSSPDNGYIRAVALKMLVAAVARVYEPGCKFDYIPVLEGKQGTGKSSAFKILAQPWFSDQIMDITSRDTIDGMRGKWIIEIGEMESHKRTETQAMKAFLSRSTDRARLAYMRCARDYPRQNIFVGTINPEAEEEVGWLKDTTGNRRYWPIPTGKIDLGALALVRDQLWAEAVAYYKKGVPLYLENEKVNAEAEAEQHKRMGVDPWAPQVHDWLMLGPGSVRIIVSAQEVFVDCIGGRLTLMTRREQVRIASIMRDLNWDKGVFYDQATKMAIRGYRRPMKGSEVIE